MVRSLLRLVAVAVVMPVGVAALVGCSSDPVADDPELVGVATVRELKEVPEADIAAPEVSGPRTLRFGYPLLSCDEAPGLPAKVEATYTVDTVAVVVTPPDPGCDETEDPAETVQGLDVFLADPVDGRDVTGSAESP